MQHNSVSFQRLRNSTRPNDLWGPPQEVLEKESKFYKSDNGDVQAENTMEKKCNEKERSAFDNPTFHTKL